MLTLNTRKLKTQKYNESFSRVYSCSLNIKTLSNKVCVRTMISSKSFYAIRALFNTAMMLSNTEMVDKINSKNTRPFVECAVDLALDHNKGVLQHKAAILKHTTNHRFPADHFFEYFCSKTNHNNVHWEPNAAVDFRTINEIGVLNEYLSTFGKDITWFYATNDLISSNFPGAKQPNVDFLVHINRAMGLISMDKRTYQDEKSGTDMFKHMTRGSIGLLTFEHSGDNIQTMTKTITCQDLIVYNVDRIESIKRYLQDNDKFNPMFSKTLYNAKLLCQEMQGKSFEEFSQLHNKLQDLLWREIQSEPLFDRSLSFIFLKQIIAHPISNQEKTFSKTFLENIQEHKLYNLDKKQDFILLYKALLKAGNTIDPLFTKKLDYLNNNGISFNTNFMLVLTDLIKHGL